MFNSDKHDMKLDSAVFTSWTSKPSVPINRESMENCVDEGAVSDEEYMDEEGGEIIPCVAQLIQYGESSQQCDKHENKEYMSQSIDSNQTENDLAKIFGPKYNYRNRFLIVLSIFLGLVTLFAALLKHNISAPDALPQEGYTLSSSENRTVSSQNATTNHPSVMPSGMWVNNEWSKPLDGDKFRLDLPPKFSGNESPGEVPSSIDASAKEYASKVKSSRFALTLVYDGLISEDDVSRGIWSNLTSQHVNDFYNVNNTFFGDVHVTTGVVAANIVAANSVAANIASDDILDVARRSRKRKKGARGRQRWLQELSQRWSLTIIYELTMEFSYPSSERIAEPNFYANDIATRPFFYKHNRAIYLNRIKKGFNPGAVSIDISSGNIGSYYSHHADNLVMGISPATKFIDGDGMMKQTWSNILTRYLEDYYNDKRKWTAVFDMRALTIIKSIDHDTKSDVVKIIYENHFQYKSLLDVDFMLPIEIAKAPFQSPEDRAQFMSQLGLYFSGGEVVFLVNTSEEIAETGPSILNEHLHSEPPSGMTFVAVSLHVAMSCFILAVFMICSLCYFSLKRKNYLRVGFNHVQEKIVAVTEENSFEDDKGKTSKQHAKGVECVDKLSLLPSHSSLDLDLEDFEETMSESTSFNHAMNANKDDAKRGHFVKLKGEFYYRVNAADRRRVRFNLGERFDDSAQSIEASINQSVTTLAIYEDLSGLGDIISNTVADLSSYYDSDNPNKISQDCSAEGNLTEEKNEERPHYLCQEKE